MKGSGSGRTPRNRLDPRVLPGAYAVHVDVDPTRGSGFRGEVAIELVCARATRRVRLHAVDLRVSGARVSWEGGAVRGSVRLLAELEMIEVELPRSVPAGDATLHLRFSGRLRRDLCGLYAASVGRRRYAFTQLEATDARKFFPCFDEPAMKARFTLSVTTGEKNAVVSNAPAAKTTGAGRGRKTVVFRETPPLSTYLLALAVGDLVRSRPVSVGPTAIRIWHPPGKQRLTGFGLEAARESLTRLEQYFDLPYPYEKLDLVAVPDFEFGAMENAGAVFFRETLLLLDPRRATLAEKKRAAEVIAHELAHMWYGNLVTMAWWDDLWLNEAFATWMAFAVVDDWKPEWRMWNDFQHGRAAALELDALRHTHPIYCPVKTAAEANENFDLITYEKGAAVVRMIERYLGASKFRRGVRRYIRMHREGNAVADDLWRALSDASGEPVGELARAWIEQPGHPMVTIARKRERGRTRLQLSQEPFGERRGSERRTRWPVPWVGRVVGPRGGRGRLERVLLRGARARIDLGRAEPRLIYGNAEESGFFRPRHAPRELAAVIGGLRSLASAERMGLVDHQWALVRAGRAPLGGFLDLVAALHRERDADVLLSLVRPLAFLSDDLVPEAAPHQARPLADFLAETFAPAFREMGWRAERGEAAAERSRRAALLTLAGSIADAPDLVREAERLGRRYLDDRRAVDPDLADAVVSLAARTGDSSLHTGFVAASADAATPQEQRRFLLALGSFREPELVRKSLVLALTPAVATQDVIFLLARLLTNPAAKEATWDFVRARWTRLEKRMPSLLASRLVETTWHLLTPQRRREVARFFRAHPVASGERALRQSLERFDWYRGFRRPAAEQLARWLGARG